MIDLTCSACSATLEEERNGSPFVKCSACGGLHTIRTVTRGQLPVNIGGPMDVVGDVISGFSYFDVKYLDPGSLLVETCHGFYNRSTGNVVQYG